MGITINRPIFFQYLNYMEENNNKVYCVNHNQNKINNNNYSINQVETKHNEFNYIISNKELIENLNENQIYDMLLKIKTYTIEELNDLSYKKALKIDKRSYCQYYISLIYTKHLLFFSFMPSFDYNSRIIKIYLFFFNFTVNFIVNALFFNDDTMHKIYTEKGSFNFIYNLPQIIYSSLISSLVINLIHFLALTNSIFIDLKQKKKKQNINNKAEEAKRLIKLKMLLFFFTNLMLLIFFWFYLGCFCAVYKNTQLHLIKDTLISLGTSMIYPFLTCILPGFLRMASLKVKKHDKECMFKFSKALQYLI